MSADNGIYTLVTKGNKLFKEYRVSHEQAIENIYYPNTQEVNLRALYQYFKDCKVFYSPKEAFNEAKHLYDEILNDDFCPIIEYGFCTLNHPEITFPEKCCEKPNLVYVDGVEQCYNCGYFV